MLNCGKRATQIMLVSKSNKPVPWEHFNDVNMCFPQANNDVTVVVGNFTNTE